LRVLHLTTEYPPAIYGGLGTAVGGLARASAAAGMDVAVLIVGEGLVGGYRTAASRSSSRFGDGSSVAIFTTPWVGAADNALRLVRAWAPDVIHLHVFWLWGVAHHLHERTGTPVAYTVHSLDLAEYEIGRGPSDCLHQWSVQEAAIGNATIVIAPTRSERALVARYCPQAVKRLVVAGHGVDDVAGSTRGANPAPIVLFAGRFVDRKGIRDLLEAIPLVAQRVPNVHFVLAGGDRGATPAEVETWWTPTHLRPYRTHVTFTGWVSQDEMRTLYDRADILVVPSWYEPFGMVVVEAMRHGLAIAASAVGGPAEILDDGRTGILFPPHDVESLAETLIRLAGDSSLRRRLGDAAMEEARRHWLWSHKVERYRDVYRFAVTRP
jgi:glycogen synthase